MATPVYNQAALTRNWWAGADADIDIHIEAYEGDIEGSMAVTSLFRSRGLTKFRSVQNQSNTWRGDRIGAAQVRGRRSGEELEASRIANDKMTITVDTTSYIRTPFDYQDDWTAPDFQAEVSREHGIAHAKAFDQAHIIQLIKCRKFVPPTHLAGSFNPGLEEVLTGYKALVATGTEESLEQAAAILVRTHKKLLTEFIKRDMGDADFVTLMQPDDFSVLVEHKKLMNVEFQGGTGQNDFARRRVGILNGVTVIETPRFPTEVITDHVLGTAFNVDAEEADVAFVLFVPSKALVTVEAKSMTVRQWDDPKEFQSVLDSYHMYTVGGYRPDSVGVGRRA